MHTIVIERSAGRRIINLGPTSNGRHETTAGREYDVGLIGGIKKGKGNGLFDSGKSHARSVETANVSESTSRDIRVLFIEVGEQGPSFVIER